MFSFGVEVRETDRCGGRRDRWIDVRQGQRREFKKENSVGRKGGARFVEVQVDGGTVLWWWYRNAEVEEDVAWRSTT